MSYPHFDYRFGLSLSPYELAQAQANKAVQGGYWVRQKKSKSGVPIVTLKREKNK